MDLQKSIELEPQELSVPSVTINVGGIGEKGQDTLNALLSILTVVALFCAPIVTFAVWRALL